ncbi:hypothetical protein ACFLRF_04645 [Candidatus Altiarchaeota archaeon]
MVGVTGCKAYSAGFVLLLLVSLVSGDPLGACVTSTNGTIFETWGGNTNPITNPLDHAWGGFGGTWGSPIIIDPSILAMIECQENITEVQCSEFAASLNLSSAWVENGSCEVPGPPQPTDFGACMLSGGVYTGYCVDNVSNLECQQYTEMDDDISVFLLVNMSCSEFAGACRFLHVSGIVMNESLCSPQFVGDTAVWQGDACCVDGYWENSMIWITQGLCESEDMLNGTFQGIGSTCATTTSTTTTSSTTSSTLACITEGGSTPIGPGAPSCCPGLTLIGCDSPASGGGCDVCVGGGYCTYCGNGDCGTGENICNCPGDCGGSSTTTTLGGGPSPTSTSTTSTTLAGPTTTLACVAEGGSKPLVPGAPLCCPGLTGIGCDSPGAGGECDPCTGAIICTYCGNGDCGAGENICNCPADCVEVGITTTTTIQGPVPVPEFPIPFIPIFVSLAIVSMMFALTKRKS